MNVFTRRMNELKNRHHGLCLFNNSDPELIHNFDDDGLFMSKFFCDTKYQGYDGMMHGGVTSAIVDSAMTNYLFGLGIVGYTIKLSLKYIKPIELGKYLNIYVTLDKNEANSLIVKNLNAYITQDNDKKVKALSTFWIVKTHK